jgi:hypothetical protein
VVAGSDAAALTYLSSIWPIILRADSAQAEQLATRGDLKLHRVRIQPLVTPRRPGGAED